MIMPTKPNTLIIGLMLIILLSFTAIAGSMAASVPGDMRFDRGDGDGANTAAFPPSIFQHWVHRVRYRCDACHDELFTMEKGSNEVSMSLIAEGKICGACHDGNEAFDDSFENCHRCHQSAD